MRQVDMQGFSLVNKSITNLACQYASTLHHRKEQSQGFSR